MSSSYLEVPDFDIIFKKTIAPIIINDVPYVTIEEREAFNTLILTTYETDVLSNIPTCACGDTQNGFNLGKTCTSCGTPVIYPAEGVIELRTWIRSPDGIISFITPVIWAQLTNLLNSKGYNLLEWMTNARSRPPKTITRETAKRIDYLINIKWERGLNAFNRNFPAFLDLLPLFCKQKGINYVAYLQTIPQNKIFPKHLPLPTKAMLILENTQVGQWADKASISGAIDAARTIAYIASERVTPLTPQQVEKMTVSVITNLVEYYMNTIKNVLCFRKRGWFRGQLFSSRSHFALRGVITSISEPHYHEEMHIPWAQGLELFKIHLVSKLLRLKYSFVDAYALIESNGNIYHPLIDELLCELIDEGPEMEITCLELRETLNNLRNKHRRRLNKLPALVSDPFTGISAILQRNPSLNRLFKAAFISNDIRKLL